ncbi:MAG TPA: PspC domain-containing protein [Acidimicrobiales bacterium]|nr:PspC domain-containing protein [Acidimicrobiales bacterium]
MRRSREDRIFGGVAGGVSGRFGIDVTIVRIGFVLLGLASGFGVCLYVVGWLLLPVEGERGTIATRAVSDRRGIVLAAAFLPALVLAVLIGSSLHVGVVTSLAVPLFVAAAGLVLVWRNAGPEESAWLHESVEPLLHFGTRSAHPRWALVGRIGVGVLLLGCGVVLAAFEHPTVVALRPVAGALLIIAAFVVLFGPWWLRLVRDLMAERQARARAEERSDVAAKVHDSVLQTLALIQRSADQPQKVVQLARAQERDLRAWLFEGRQPGPIGDVSTMAAGMHAIAREIESDHHVSVEVVTVGDCPLTESLRSTLAAVREATLNAAKWSGAPVVSLFCEVEPNRVSVFVRDRGKGFDPDAVAGDRRGLTESIRGRMARIGGEAVVRTAAGQGTEVELAAPRNGREERDR